MSKGGRDPGCIMTKQRKMNDEHTRNVLRDDLFLSIVVCLYSVNRLRKVQRSPLYRLESAKVGTGRRKLQADRCEADL
jgi:hypothetical protein